MPMNCPSSCSILRISIALEPNNPQALHMCAPHTCCLVIFHATQVDHKPYSVPLRGGFGFLIVAFGCLLFSPLPLTAHEMTINVQKVILSMSELKQPEGDFMRFTCRLVGQLVIVPTVSLADAPPTALLVDGDCCVLLQLTKAFCELVQGDSFRCDFVLVMGLIIPTEPQEAAVAQQALESAIRKEDGICFDSVSLLPFKVAVQQTFSAESAASLSLWKRAMRIQKSVLSQME